MGDAEDDDQLLIFKCLVDTGADVLRGAVERKLLNITGIQLETYLDNSKHQFYHQFEKNIRKPCCSGSPHGCNITGIMDRKIFYKMYQKTAKVDTSQCLDRFTINPGISVKSLDLSDLYFILWNSGTLSVPERESLQTIMSIRSAICHSPSSNSYSKIQIKDYWLSLETAILLFVEPISYKSLVERQIALLRESKPCTRETEQILQALMEVKRKNDCIENLVEDGTVELKNGIVDVKTSMKDEQKLFFAGKRNNNLDEEYIVNGSSSLDEKTTSSKRISNIKW
ncbi:unnamed protein product [Mytilus coruscus]|uniref:DZIP3-like HEPN domain-containing protein n=1 Tax=Mytilus coruscus TaxID=42192 RepID=A0A6J8ETB7_MYTCO|nr:unnamed protein product [Mytilus coruscus]